MRYLPGIQILVLGLILDLVTGAPLFVTLFETVTAQATLTNTPIIQATSPIAADDLFATLIPNGALSAASSAAPAAAPTSSDSSSLSTTISQLFTSSFWNKWYSYFLAAFNSSSSPTPVTEQATPSEAVPSLSTVSIIQQTIPTAASYPSSPQSSVTSILLQSIIPSFPASVEAASTSPLSLSPVSTYTPSTFSTSTTSQSAQSDSSSTSGIYDAIYNSPGIDVNFARSILDAHNTDRAIHQVAPLSWNTDAYNYAQNNANNYDCSGILTHTHGPYGENLAAGFANGPAAVEAWYVEGETYNYQTANTYDHFTQLVWKGSTSVGCAYKNCQAENWGLYIVCEYDPPGNVIGYNSQNVFPPTSAT
ncbi:CAP domain-containing protein [Scheffersomyces amazonensis]|uniref:CAP domain-containing protein n=1 Tax=Scheffersomyces amazonensis TaxID=1078765 RepID=UPI00315C7EAA